MQSALIVCGLTSRRREAWACCSLDHRVGSPRQSEPYHHCDQSHQLSKLLHKKIDDIIFQILISFLPMASFLIMLTCLQWNLLIAVAIHSFQIGNMLDPVLDLCYPRIDTMARTLAAIAHNSNLGKSEINEHFAIYMSQNNYTYLPFSCTISGPPESPWHVSLPLEPAQIWNL